MVILTSLLPYFELIVFSYFVDAVIASIHEGSPQPVGKFFSWLWEMASDVFERISEIAQVVADAIPF
jgi:hypothetical protein